MMNMYQTLEIKIIILSQNDIVRTSPNETDDVISVPSGGFNEDFNP